MITFRDRRTGRILGRVDGRSLAGLDLRGVDFKAQDLSGVSFAHADLSGADLCNCNLSGCSFFKANLTGTKLFGHVHDDAALTSCWTPAPRPNWRVRRKKPRPQRIMLPRRP